MPCTLSPPFGTSLRLIYDEGNANEIDLTLSAPGDFRGDSGQSGRLGVLGYDRIEQEEYYRSSSISSGGTSFQVGPEFRIPYRFTAHLLLLEAQVRNIEAMFLRQQDTPESDILLLDHRIMLQEPSPRTRARHDAATVAPVTAAGMVAFWPIYRVEISKFEVQSFGVRSSGQLRYSYNLEMVERYPALGTGGDR